MLGWRAGIGLSLGRWLEVGWEGSPPYFIYMHHTPIFTAPEHLFFVFSVSNVLACLLCLSAPGVRSGRAALHAAVRASGSPNSNLFGRVTLNGNVSMPKPGSGQALVRVFGSSVNPVNVVLVELICEDFGCLVKTIGTDIAGVVVAVGHSRVR